MILSVLLLTISTLGLKAQNVKSTIGKSISQMRAAKSYQYTFYSTERIKGEFIKSSMEVKLNLSPRKIYANNLTGPNKGKEILYVKGENSNKVLVNALWGVSLSPFSSLMRKGNHHTVHQFGFGKVIEILDDAMQKAEKENAFEQVFQLKGTVEYAGKPCYKIVIEDPTFTYKNYTIKNGESLYRIAQRNNINEQLIVEKNSNLSGFGSAKDGLQIKIPSSYAKKSILYIDKENFHCVYQELYDDKGMFETYKFQHLKINPNFSTEEFTKDYKDYNF